MTKKVTENMSYLNPQRTRYLGVLVDIGNFWASLLLPLREQVSDGHSSGSLQDADSTLEIQGQENLRQAECCPVFPRCWLLSKPVNVPVCPHIAPTFPRRSFLRLGETTTWDISIVV
jgi:hypothetical protein